MSEVTKVHSMDRTYIGMRDGLFDMWDGIRNKLYDVREVEAVARLSHAICKTVDIELKVHKAESEYPHQREEKAIKLIQLGTKD